MLFAGREVRIGKNCALGLEYGLEGRTQDRGHSFSQYGPPGRQITCLFFSSVEYFVSSFCVQFSLQPFWSDIPGPGLSSTLIYTSELILCSTICVPCATRHNIH